MKAILILIDSLNREYLKTYNENTWVQTPNIYEFSRTATRFDKHFVGSVPCMPARRDIMTGRLNFLERNWGPMEPFDNCFVRDLKEKDIFTHIITDHDHYFEQGGENFVQEFDTWDYIRGQELDPWVSTVELYETPESHYGHLFPTYEKNKRHFTSEEKYPTPMCFQNAIDWIKENKDADNYFLQVEAFSPHEPFESPKEYLEAYGDDYKGPFFTSSSYSKVTEPPEAIEHLRKRYAASLTMVDKWFGKFIDTIKELGLYDDTLIVLTADHGHLLGEHGYTGKNFMHQYNRIANIPLMIHAPGQTEYAECSDLVTQNIDMMPTFLEYFGLKVPERVQGESLIDAIYGKKIENHRDFAIYGTFGGPVAMFDGKYTYHRAPGNKDNAPLNLYTSVPISFMKYLGIKNADEITMGRFLKHTNYPVYCIPAKFPLMQLKSLEPFKDTLLFDWENDWGQENPIDDMELREAAVKKLREALRWAESPDEQFERLGLVMRRSIYNQKR